MSKVEVGKKVTVKFSDGLERVVIVPARESNLLHNRISVNCPLAQAILDGYIGESMTFKNESGELITCEIVAVD